MNIHSFCCTGPDLATDGCYPLCCSLVSGLSYPRKFENQQAIFLVECKDTFFVGVVVSGCVGEFLERILLIRKTSTRIFKFVVWIILVLFPRFLKDGI